MSKFSSLFVVFVKYYKVSTIGTNEKNTAIHKICDIDLTKAKRLYWQWGLRSC